MTHVTAAVRAAANADRALAPCCAEHENEYENKPVRGNAIVTNLDDAPLSDLIAHVHEGRIDPAALPAERRRACVAHLAQQGFSVAESAQLLRVSERTLQRDRAALRTDNALRPSTTLGDELMGELHATIAASNQRLTRLAAAPDTPAYVKVWAENTLVRHALALIEKTRELEYIPTARARLGDLIADDPATVRRRARKQAELRAMMGGPFALLDQLQNKLVHQIAEGYGITLDEDPTSPTAPPPSAASSPAPQTPAPIPSGERLGKGSKPEGEDGDNNQARPDCTDGEPPAHTLHRSPLTPALSLPGRGGASRGEPGGGSPAAYLPSGGGGGGGPDAGIRLPESSPEPTDAGQPEKSRALAERARVVAGRATGPDGGAASVAGGRRR